jgi:sialate O-acetylesterase
MKALYFRIILLSLFFFSAATVMAEVKLPPLFTDHMVLQRNVPVNIWGWANKGEKVTVTINQQRKSVKTDQTGKWLIQLDPLQAGGPYTITITGKNTITLHDVLVGEVWLCSGQSNMVFTVKDTKNATAEIPTANYPQIRQFKVPETMKAAASTELKGAEWKVCSPETVGDFTGVVYYFAKYIQQELKVPVGIINASWGGTFIEAWTSNGALNQLNDYKEVPSLTDAELDGWINNLESLFASYAIKLNVKSWDNYKTDDTNWQSEKTSDANWISVPFPGDFDKALLPRFDGTVWFRTFIDLPENVAPNDITLHLGKIDDADETFINGEKIGATNNLNVVRNYTVSSKLLKPGRNLLAIKLTDYWETGGFVSPTDQIFIEGTNGFKLPLINQTWKMNIASVTRVWIRSPNMHPSLLFNGMIYPLLQATIKGVLWYQGENNAEFAFQYRELLPALIADWRKHFQQPQLPFYSVQLPNYQRFNQNSQNGGSNWAELREAFTLSAVIPNTGYVVTTDVGDSADIHPTNKEDVGKRLALLALNRLYNKQIVYSGPELDHAEYVQDKAIVYYKNSASALVARNRYGYVLGFEIAGNDQQFKYAAATIEGNKIILYNKEVAKPVAVRYNWSSNPEGNLFNEAGLPAAPFRTDDWKLSTFGKTYNSWIGNKYKRTYTVQ